MNQKSPNRMKKPPNDMKHFYNRYFLNFWEIKYNFLKKKLENFDSLDIQSELNIEDDFDHIDKNFLAFLKFEIHFLKFQIIESLFSLIFALEEGDDLNLWFNLSFPKDSSGRSFAVYDRISGFSRNYSIKEFINNKNLGTEKEPYELWRHIFFHGIEFSEYDKNWKDIQNNIEKLFYNVSRHRDGNKRL
jgi:hypothetical protein